MRIKEKIHNFIRGYGSIMQIYHNRTNYDAFDPILQTYNTKEHFKQDFSNICKDYELACTKVLKPRKTE